METTPKLPNLSSLKNLTTGLAQLTNQLTTLATDAPGRQQVVQHYQSLHKQVGDARCGLRDVTL